MARQTIAQQRAERIEKENALEAQFRRNKHFFALQFLAILYRAEENNLIHDIKIIGASDTDDFTIRWRERNDDRNHYYHILTNGTRCNLLEALDNITCMIQAETRRQDEARMKAEAKQKALAKLTTDERKLLGL